MLKRLLPHRALDALEHRVDIGVGIHALRSSPAAS